MTDDGANYRPADDRYWAAEMPDRIASAVAHQFARYVERCANEGRLEVWRTADRCYHGRNPDGGYATSQQITFAGTQGEVAQMHVGHFRQIVGAQLTIATEQRPAIEVTATSNDPEAISETIVARQVLEYDLDEAGLERALHRVHEAALIYAEGYLVQAWDFEAGEEIGTRLLAPEIVDTEHAGIPGAEGDAGQVQAEGVEVPVHEGAVSVCVRLPIDVARDLDLDDTADPPWYVVRTRAHRWELASRYPEDAKRREAILDAPGAAADDWALWKSRGRGGTDSDYVHVLTLYHPPSAALPMGRLVEVVDAHAISDQPYPYDHQVVHADVPSTEQGRAQGYGDAWDMLAPSQALDAVESGMLSVADAGALTRYIAPRGQKVDVRQLDTGMSLIEYDDNGLPGMRPPGLMDRPEVRDSDRSLSAHYRQTLEMLSGISATTRGLAQSEVKSGADRALIATMAVRANSKHQRAYAGLARSALNGRVKLYATFAGQERLIEIAGRDKSGHVASFSASTMRKVRRVRVELGPPDLRTVEGKVALADKMLEAYGPEVISPDRYMALRVIGRIDDLDNNIAEHKTNARRENDMFREGQGARVQVALFDHHACHLREHVREALDPAVRYATEPAAIAALGLRLAHLTAHAQAWRDTPPEILAATGQDPAPSTLMRPAGGPPPMGAMPPEPPPIDGGPQAPPPGADGGPGGPKLPQMPMIGGQRYEPGMGPPGAA